MLDFACAGWLEHAMNAWHNDNCDIDKDNPYGTGNIDRLVLFTSQSYSGTRTGAKQQCLEGRTFKCFLYVCSIVNNKGHLLYMRMSSSIRIR